MTEMGGSRPDTRPLRVAMIGQKGIPATHGGVEHHVEQLGRRLVELGHEVTVFTRPQYTDPSILEYAGMRTVSVPTIGTKHLDAIVHSLLCTLRCLTGRYDVVHYHAIGPCLLSPLARLSGVRVVATIHGQDWRRAKWNRIASAILRFGEWIALRVPHATISVSQSLARQYKDAGARRVVYIPNGVCVTDGSDDEAFLEELGVADTPYILFVGRLVPEKGLHTLIEAWRPFASEFPLVVAGDTSHSDEYVDRLKQNADVIFPGYVYGIRLATLFRRATLFVLPSDLEGLPLVLLEALAYGAPVLASDIAPNVEVLGENGVFFRTGDVDELRSRLADVLEAADALKREALGRAQEVAREYDWDRVAGLTDELYRSL